jgi:hypothetical protein
MIRPEQTLLPERTENATAGRDPAPAVDGVIHLADAGGSPRAHDARRTRHSSKKAQGIDIHA